MSSNKTLALALCLAITGCAQTPQNDAEGGHKWWQLGASDQADAPASVDKKDAVATKPADKKAAAPVVAKAAPAPAVADAKKDSGFDWWPFGSDSAKKDTPAQKPKTVAAAPATATSTEKNWWWPFGSTAKDSKTTAANVVPMPDPKITQAWLDEYEPRLRAAIKDTNLQLERRESLLVIVASADSSFKTTRPDLLMPSMLGPFTRVAKVVEGDPKTAVLVLGHADSTGAMAGNTKLSLDRARSVAAIFRMSGLQANRLTLRGMGSVMPRAANDSNEGRALNRRVEILMTPQNTMLALVSKYSQPTLSPADLVAVQPAVAPTKAVAAKKGAAASKKAVVAKKSAPAKKPVKAAPAKKAVVAKSAAAKKDVANAQAKN